MKRAKPDTSMQLDLDLPAIATAAVAHLTHHFT